MTVRFGSFISVRRMHVSDDDGKPFALTLDRSTRQKEAICSGAIELDPKTFSASFADVTLVVNTSNRASPRSLHWQRMTDFFRVGTEPGCGADESSRITMTCNREDNRRHV